MPALFQFILGMGATLADIAALFIAVRLICHFRPAASLATLDHAGAPLVAALTDAVDRALTRLLPNLNFSQARLLATTLLLVALARLALTALTSAL